MGQRDGRQQEKRYINKQKSKKIRRQLLKTANYERGNNEFSLAENMTLSVLMELKK